jgi:hypothetical protein
MRSDDYCDIVCTIDPKRLKIGERGRLAGCIYARIYDHPPRCTEMHHERLSIPRAK